MKKLIVCALAVLVCRGLYANDGDSLLIKQEQAYKDSIDKSLKYESGSILLANGAVQLQVPPGFKFLDAAQSHFVLTGLWNNRHSKDVLGMIFPENGGPHSENSYAFVVSYELIGYVKDQEKTKPDYDELLLHIQKKEAADNEERKKNGYPTVHTIAWAQPPFYDRNNKVLHWAMELRYEDEAVNKVNYEVCTLGRKGVLNFFAVADMKEIELVKRDMGMVLHMANFTEGNKYTNFNSNTDKVSALSVSGLIAGELHTGNGILPFIIKFGRLILIGIVALGGITFVLLKCKRPREEMA